MRDQLHLMELVDHYLDGTMNPTDRIAFEERVRDSEELRSLVEDQKRLRQAARRSPARAAAKQAYRNYRWGKSLPGMAAGAVVLIAATAALFLWKSPMAGGGSENTPISESEYRTLTDTTGTHLDPLVLTIDPKKDTTLVTPNGIVLDIPQGAFVDSLGAPITTPVRLTLLEALDPLDIMKAGLSTMSGDMLLETGGMFYLDAQANGKAVKIDPAKPLTAMVPAEERQEGMQLYQGVKTSDGTIDWQNPKPLKKSLVPVDITTLNFYPPGYEAKLAELGQDVTNKAFKDSLYYSMRCPVRNMPMGEDGASQKEYVEPMAFNGHGAALAMVPQAQSEQSFPDPVIFSYDTVQCGIDPAKMASLKAVFGADGRTTAANSSQISDGAAALLIADREYAECNGLIPRARFRALSVAAADPIIQFTAILDAAHKALGRSGLAVEEIDLFEVNEAFAGVPLIFQREFGVPDDKLNVNGGSVALGHPLGSTGARMLTDLLCELERSGKRFGLQTVCEATGTANATIIERI